MMNVLRSLRATAVARRLRAPRGIATLVAVFIVAGALVAGLVPFLPPDHTLPVDPAAADSAPAVNKVRAGLLDAVNHLVLPVPQTAGAPAHLPLTDIAPFSADALDLRRIVGDWFAKATANPSVDMAALSQTIDDAKPMGRAGEPAGVTASVVGKTVSESDSEAVLHLPVTFERTFAVPVSIQTPNDGVVAGGLVSYVAKGSFTLDLHVDKNPDLALSAATYVVPGARVTTVFTGTVAAGASTTRYGFTRAKIEPQVTTKPELTFTAVVNDQTGDQRLTRSEWDAASPAALLTTSIGGNVDATFVVTGGSNDATGAFVPLGSGATMTTVAKTGPAGDPTQPTITTSGALLPLGRVSASAATAGVGNLTAALSTTRRLGGAPFPMLAGTLAPVFDQVVNVDAVAEAQAVSCTTTEVQNGQSTTVPFESRWYPSGTTFSCSARVANAPAGSSSWRIWRSSGPSQGTVVASTTAVGTDPTPIDLVLPDGAGLPMIEAVWSAGSTNRVARPPAATMQDVSWVAQRAGLGGGFHWNPAANEVTVDLASSVGAGTIDTTLDLGDSFADGAGVTAVRTDNAAEILHGAATFGAALVVRLDQPPAITPAPNPGDPNSLPSVAPDTRFSLRAARPDGTVLRVDDVSLNTSVVDLTGRAGFVGLQGRANNLALGRVNPGLPAVSVALRNGTGVLPTVGLADIEQVQANGRTYVETVANMQASGSLMFRAPEVQGLDAAAGRSFSFTWASTVAGNGTPTAGPVATRTSTAAPTITPGPGWDAIRKFADYEKAAGSDRTAPHALHDVVLDGWADELDGFLTGDQLTRPDSPLDAPMPLTGQRFSDALRSFGVKPKLPTGQQPPPGTGDIASLLDLAKSQSSPTLQEIGTQLQAATTAAGNTMTAGAVRWKLDGDRLVATLTMERCTTGMTGCLATPRSQAALTKLVALADGLPGLAKILPSVSVDSRQFAVLEIAVPLTWGSTPMVTPAAKAGIEVSVHGPTPTAPVTIPAFTGKIGSASMSLTGEGQADVAIDLAADPGERSVPDWHGNVKAKVRAPSVCTPAAYACLTLRATANAPIPTGGDIVLRFPTLTDAPTLTLPASWATAAGPKILGTLDAGQLLDGMSALLNRLDGVAGAPAKVSINGSDQALSRLPLIGDRLDGGIGDTSDLAGLATYLSDARAAYRPDLAGSVDALRVQLQAAANKLAKVTPTTPAGDLPTVEILPTTATTVAQVNDIRIHYKGTSSTTCSACTKGLRDLGLDGLPLTGLGAGGLDVTASASFDLVVGMDKDHGPYLDLGGNKALKLTTTAGLAAHPCDPADAQDAGRGNRCLDAKLGFLDVKVRDAIDPSGVTAETTVGLVPRSGSKISADDLASGLVRARFDKPTVTAHLDLRFRTKIGNSGGLPEIAGTLVWKPGDALQIKDATVDIGSFLTRFLEPITRRTKQLMAPISPIIDTLTAPIPVVSDIAKLVGKPPVTLLGELERYLRQQGQDPKKLQYLHSIISFLKLARELGDIGSTGVVRIGDARIDIGRARRASSAKNADRVIDSLANGPGIGSDQSLLSTTVKRPGVTTFNRSNALGVDGLTFPFLDEPRSVFGLLLGQDVDLVRYDLGTLDAGIGIHYDYGPFMVGPVPVMVHINGNVDVGGHLAFGMDTSGLRQGVSVDHFIDGFFVDDLDARGRDVPELHFGAGVSVEAGASIRFIEAGMGGGLDFHVDFNLHAPDKDGKLHAAQLAKFLERPACLFDMSGGLEAYLDAYFKVDYFFGSKKWSWELLRLSLFDFKKNVPNCTDSFVPPALANVAFGATVVATTKVNGDVRTFYNGTLVITSSDGDDDVVVRPIEVGQIGLGDQPPKPGGLTNLDLTPRTFKRTITVPNGMEGFDVVVDETVEHPFVGIQVESQGRTQEFYGWFDVQFSGGSGNDSFVAQEGRRTHLVQNGNTITQEIDTLPFAAVTRVSGGYGNDRLVGGAGTDYIDGGGGDDSISGGQGAPVGTATLADLVQALASKRKVPGDFLLGDDGHNDIEGGDSSDVIVADKVHRPYYEDGSRLNGGGGSDLIIGGSGADEITGGMGVNDRADFLIGDGGNDTLDGGPGDDILEGKRGDDTIYGGLGNDVVVGDDDVETGRNDQSVVDLQGFAGLAQDLAAHTRAASLFAACPVDPVQGTTRSTAVPATTSSPATPGTTRSRAARAVIGSVAGTGTTPSTASGQASCASRPTPRRSTTCSTAATVTTRSSVTPAATIWWVAPAATCSTAAPAPTCSTPATPTPRTRRPPLVPGRLASTPGRCSPMPMW